MTAAYILLQGSVAPNSERAGRSLPKDEALDGDLGPGTVEDHVRSFAADVAKILVAASQCNLPVQEDGGIVFRLVDGEGTEGDVWLQGGLGGLDGRLEFGKGVDGCAAAVVTVVVTGIVWTFGVNENAIVVR